MLIAVSAGGISKVLELSWWDVRQRHNSRGGHVVDRAPLKGSVGNFGDGKEGEKGKKEGKKKEEVEKRRGQEKKKGKERRGKVRKIRGKEG